MTLRMKLAKESGALLVIFALAGCASMGRSAKTNNQNPDAPQIAIAGGEEPSRDVMANIAKPYQSPLGEVPLDQTQLTEKWIQYFQGRGRKYMEKYLERSTRYLPMMKNTLRENGLPEDLVYVALIESGFSPLAHSHANAVGYWQFIRATGKRYGLMLDPFIDERRDPVLSTRAAAEYFKTLYNMFGSWHLSLASYNVGENRVKRAVAAYYTRDFWELVKKRKAFPKETKHYVPKFIAAALIAKDPAKYGFTNIEYQAPLAFDTVKLTNPVSMTKLSLQMGLSVDDMQALNPKFRGDYVPKYRGDETVIRVPVGKAEVASAAILQSFVDQPKVISAEYYYYRIKRGDVLSSVARRHRTSVANLRKLNGLSNRSVLRVGQRLKVPDRGGAFVSYEMPAGDTAGVPVAQNVAAAPAVANPAPTASAPVLPETQPVSATATEASPDTAAKADEKPANRDAAGEKPTHVVRRGENLSTIARKYGLTVDELRRLNKLSNRAVLKVGQVLRLRANEQQSEQDPGVNDTSRLVSKVKAIGQIARQQKNRISERQRAPAESQSWVRPIRKKIADVRRHRVRPGETLAEIARRYRVTVGSLAKKNDLKNRSHLLAGADLIIPR